jgi:hypothetical protein
MIIHLISVIILLTMTTSMNGMFTAVDVQQASAAEPNDNDKTTCSESNSEHSTKCSQKDLPFILPFP